MKANCPICQKEIDPKENRYRPFCSERCKLIDLGRWTSGGYRIVAPPDEAETENAEPSEREAPRSKDDSGRLENGRASS
jgi:endogenous inhibitor of DNA gyrase (YacG/DUF329 family)